jgi:hypothetical protein
MGGSCKLFLRSFGGLAKLLDELGFDSRYGQIFFISIAFCPTLELCYPMVTGFLPGNVNLTTLEVLNRFKDVWELYLYSPFFIVWYLIKHRDKLGLT